ncbi:hypothetical protein M409DRAFT_29818 [Zasmidium cellare ATCC 36951]|uniref:DUF6590 domain-containing protein n=1 Tax=Zasmidium cellare ATCC 36951 TaxID=1080233 RepID=A0A6A6BXY5_ZASCE|nr:uncharacterized protein M409DRAFT_29818 [Zasmidium cellare ATCC 36951]KAF2159651.1 hypothetical protein M409DRAFT_29818 [Zasmidium cellare ATCC 36951]
MSGPGNRPGPQDWTWSDHLQDYYWRNPSTGQFWVSNRGNPRPITAPPQNPRLEQPVSRSDVRASSHPTRAGSASGRDLSYSLHPGPPGISDASNPTPGQQIAGNRSESQYITPRGGSTYSASPPAREFSRARSGSVHPSDASQSPSQRPRDRNDGPTQQRMPQTTGGNPIPRASEATSSYSPQARPFVPGSPQQVPMTTDPAMRFGSSHSSLNNAMAKLDIGAGSGNQTGASPGAATGAGRSGEYVNPDTGVRSVVRFGDVITDPSLGRMGVVVNSQLAGTVGDKEQLYPEFKKRTKPKNFFTVGKVFMMLWAEPAGDSGRSNTLITSQERSTIPGKFGQMVFSKVRRFVVIREGEGYCTALPIVSYDGQGAAKPGVLKREHGIAYIGKQPPEPTEGELPRRGEEGMLPRPVRIDPDQKTEKLTTMSRINYGKVYTVEHNVKVRSLGTVSGRTLQALLYQFKYVWDYGTSGRRGSVGRSEQDSSSGSRMRPISEQTDYNAAIRYFMSKGLTKEQAEATVKQRSKASAARTSINSDSGEETEASDDDEEQDPAQDASNAQMEKTIRQLQKYSGLSRGGAIAVLRGAQRTSQQAKSKTGEASDEEESDQGEAASKRGKSKATRSKQLELQQAAQIKAFHDRVAALHQQGVSYEEAYRSVRASMSHGRGLPVASTSQSGSTRRPQADEEGESEDQDPSSEEASEDDDDDEEDD